MSDQISSYIEQLEDALKNIRRNLASWRSFSTKNSLPIVQYNASVDGVKTVEAISDLSILPEEQQATISGFLVDFHGEEALRSLVNLQLIAEQFALVLTGNDSEKEEILEAEYPSSSGKSDDDDEFE
jgi:hypothetical protein